VFLLFSAGYVAELNTTHGYADVLAAKLSDQITTAIVSGKFAVDLVYAAVRFFLLFISDTLYCF
jgi:hypothetical protein